MMNKCALGFKLGLVEAIFFVVFVKKSLNILTAVNKSKAVADKRKLLLKLLASRGQREYVSQY